MLDDQVGAPHQRNRFQFLLKKDSELLCKNSTIRQKERGGKANAILKNILSGKGTTKGQRDV